MTKDEIVKKHKQYLFPSVTTYYTDPLVTDHASMQHVWDVEGNKYLDFFGGIVTISVGHANARVTGKIKAQVDKLQHASTVFPNEAVVALAEKIAQITLNLLQIACGSVICLPIIASIRFLLNASCDTISTTEKAQYSTVGFHLMKVSLCRTSVAPPNTVTTPRLTHSIGSTLRCRKATHAICTSVATIATAVAVKMPHTLKATKNRMIGNRSNRNFIYLTGTRRVGRRSECAASCTRHPAACSTQPGAAPEEAN